MDRSAATFLDRSEEITGYQVKILKKPAFQIAGYTLIIPPHSENEQISQFLKELKADGRLDTLKQAAPSPGWILGLGSWDEACQPGGMRYTLCIEEADQTGIGCLKEDYPIHRQSFEACDWMAFEIPQGNLDALWKDDPYKMLRQLGYRFHLRVGVHFDVWPPDHDEKTKPGMEFWISVAEEDEACDPCPVRDDCARIEPFKG